MALAAVTLVAYLAWSSDKVGSLHYLCFDFLERSSPAFYRMNCAPTVDDTSDLGMCEWVGVDGGGVLLETPAVVEI